MSVSRLESQRLHSLFIHIFMVIAAATPPDGILNSHFPLKNIHFRDTYVFLGIVLVLSQQFYFNSTVITMLFEFFFSKITPYVCFAVRNCSFIAHFALFHSLMVCGHVHVQPLEGAHTPLNAPVVIYDGTISTQTFDIYSKINFSSLSAHTCIEIVCW